MKKGNKGSKGNKGNKKKRILLWLGLTLVLLAGAFFLVKDVVLKHIYPLDFEEKISKYSTQYEVDPYLIATVIWAESDYDPDAVSNKGASGLMQIMPDTGEWIAGKLKIKNYEDKQLFDPEVSIRMGCWYLQYLAGKVGDDTRLILAAYNAGPGKVQDWLENKDVSKDGKTLDNIPYKETRDYVDKIVRAYDVYKFLYTIG